MSDIDNLVDAINFYEDGYAELDDFLEQFRSTTSTIETICDQVKRIDASIWKIINEAESDPSLINQVNASIASRRPEDGKPVKNVEYLKIVLQRLTDAIIDPKNEPVIGKECQEDFKAVPRATRSKKVVPVRKRSPTEEAAVIEPIVGEEPKEMEITDALKKKFMDLFDKASKEVLSDPVKYGLRKPYPTRYLHDRFFSNAQQRNIKYAIKDLESFITLKLDNKPYMDAMVEFFKIFK